MRWVALAVLLAAFQAQAAPDRRRSTTFAQTSWDVTCPMSSDTCSDGRKITTVRASPAQCETAPGVWTTIPADTGCYGVRGLDSWSANTSYLSWGAELDRSPWGPSARGGSLERLADGWRSVKNPSQSNSGWQQPGVSVVPGGTVTGACIVRGFTPFPSRMFVGSSQFCTRSVDTSGLWETWACTQEVPSTGLIAPYPCGNQADAECSFDLKACWHVRAATPGRPVWGGEAPVTVAADRNRIPSSGFPTEEGYIEIVATIGATPFILLDGRFSQAAEVVDTVLRLHTNGELRLARNTTAILDTPPLEWVMGRPYRIRLERRNGEVAIYRDEVLLASAVGPPFSWQADVTFGASYSAATNHINGSISRLSWRSK